MGVKMKRNNNTLRASIFTEIGNIIKIVDFLDIDDYEDVEYLTNMRGKVDTHTSILRDLIKVYINDTNRGE